MKPMRLLPLLLYLPLVSAQTTPPATDISNALQELTLAVRYNKAKDYEGDLKRLEQAIAKAKEKDAWDKAVVAASIISLFALIWTGWLTHKMRAAAQQQADSALAQSSAAQQMLEEVRTQTLLDSRPILVPENAYGSIQVLAMPYHVPLGVKNIGRGPALRVRLYALSDDIFELVRSEDSTLPVLEQNAVDRLPIHTIFLTSTGLVNCQDVVTRLYKKELKNVSLALEYDDVLQGTWRSYVVLEAGESEHRVNCRLLRVERQETQTAI